MPEFNAPKRKKHKLNAYEIDANKKTNAVEFKVSKGKPKHVKPSRNQAKKQEQYSREALYQVPPTALAKRRPKAPPKKVRRKRRSGNRMLYYILFAIFVVATVSILSVTILFNAERIVVEGSSKYTDEQLIEASGLSGNENLVRLDVSDARKRILEKMVYIDDIEIRKDFPSTITFAVKGAVPMADIYWNNKYYVVSHNMRILEIDNQAQQNITVVDGIEAAENLIEGDYFTAADEAQVELLNSIEAALEEVGLKNITEINIADKLDITLWYDGRIELMLGSTQQLNEKFIIAKTLIETQIGENERVSLLLTNTEKVAQRNITEATISEETPEEINSDGEIGSDGEENSETENTDDYVEDNAE